MMYKLTVLFSLVFSSITMANQPAQRVISLAPHATEIAYAAGLGDKLIAVSESSNYPIQVNKLEKVANYQGIKLERILALKPDLVIAWPTGNPAKELEKIKQFDVPIYYASADSLEDIAYNIEQLSLYSENPQIGQNKANAFRAKLKVLKEKYNTEDKVRYFYQLSDKPLITVVGENWPSEVFTFCGGENIFTHSGSPYPQVSIEQVLTRQPDIIFTSHHSMAMVHSSLWREWQSELPAVKNGHIWSLNSDWLSRPTPRTLNAITEVCQHFENLRQKH